MNLDFFFFFSLFEKVGLSRDWKRNILLGWPNKETKDLKKKKNYRMFTLSLEVVISN